MPKDVTVNGSIHSALSGYIDGTVEGNLKTEGSLIISQNAIIRGNVYANDLIVYGRIYGDIFCTNKTVLANTSYIKGNISAGELDIKEGAVIEGIIKKSTDAHSVTERKATMEEQDEQAKITEETAAPLPNVQSSIEPNSSSSNWF